MLLTRLFPLGLLLWLSSCSPYLHQPLRTTTARLGEETAVTAQLRQLPPPMEPIYVAVYKFRDQTGQYKPSEVGANWSTAVTQGGTSILLEALENSGWFIAVERENVSNLLNERRIIRNSRMQYRQVEDEESLLPPLLFAGIILEGGIISYDANVLTGGLGARYFGTGGSTEYRQDRVSVYLRAISTNTGQVLKTVYTSRTILSQAIDVGLFRFVSFQRLLEAETGFTYNEPSEIAVTEAIEKAVYFMVMEGLADSLWLTDPAYPLETERAVALFRSEQAEMAATNYLGRQYQPMSAIGSVAFGITPWRFQGDVPGADWSCGYDLSVSWQARPWLRTGLGLYYGHFVPRQHQQLGAVGFDWETAWRCLPNDRLSPLVVGGLGLLRATQQSDYDPPEVNHLSARIGLGAEFRIAPAVSIEAVGGYTYLFSDNLDLYENGRFNDMYWQTRLGLRIYLNDR
ncbi:MAG: CsgG/HfaB family protein [Lewinella sp.]|nr:CsgG/HfaB family protein [Lewinella sp.]